MTKSIEQKAIEFCEKHKHRYTEPREKVLKIIASSDRPIKAYEILKKLAEQLNNPKPPTGIVQLSFGTSPILFIE